MSNRRTCLSVLVALIALCISISWSTVRAATRDIVNCDGYPCANFAFGANVSRQVVLFASMFYHPPRLGAGLEPLGGGQFELGIEGDEFPATDCESVKVDRRWPFARIEATDPRMPGITLRVEAFSPNVYDDAFSGSLPLAIANIDLVNQGDSEQTLVLRFRPHTFFQTESEPLQIAGCKGAVAGSNVIAWIGDDTSEDGDSNPYEVRLVVPARGACRCKLVVGHWEDGYPCSARLTDPTALVTHVQRYGDRLTEASKRLEQRLPATGDAEVDDYFRWYMTAGVAMTKVLKDGTALTMGYHELNQRDSFWTTWAHLVLWPSLEKRMIQESMWGQRPDGKVPTTILPVIERNEDVDINCYFILRGLRYVHFHSDDEFGRQLLPSLKQAADWLASRDTTGAGLPRQTSFWNDWKDVPGMERRLYSPYASMLYVAAMQRLAEYCEHLGDTEGAERYIDLADRGQEMLNKPVADGGLFNGRYYEHIWASPPDDKEHVSEDQVVGIVFNVIPPEAQQSVLNTLEKSSTKWGVRDTFPFFEGDFGYQGGDYHNGGIWPYMNQVHAWALFKAGRTREGLALLREVGHADLVQAGDYIPHEYLHGTTGEQAGVPMQGWNAAVFGAVYFGFEDRLTP